MHASRTTTAKVSFSHGTVQLLFGALLFGALWYAWAPFQVPFFGDEVQASVIEQTGLSEQQIAAAAEFDLRRSAAPRVPENGRSVVVDLVGRELVLYDDAAEMGVYPIVRYADPSGPSAIVAGTYTVEAEAALKSSTLAKVRFPAYVQFGGRYAVHGTPTDEQGNARIGTYAGSSIELTTDDAKALRSFVDEGTPLYVRTEAERDQYGTVSDLVATDGALPATSAYAFAVSDLARGQLLLEKNVGVVRPIASITKLITAMVASDLIGHGSEVFAYDGHSYMLGDLFYPLLLRSNNKIAADIAAHLDTRTFIGAMNAYVQKQGMPVTSFGDASGLSPKNVSSAYDLSTLARHLYRDRGYLLDMSREDAVSITSVDGSVWDMVNQNKLASDLHFRGGKLGYTDEAGQTALSIFTVPIDGETRTISVVVLGAKDWKQDTRTLLRWVLEHVELE